MKPGRTGLARIAYATRYSYHGLLFAWHNESAFRQELGLCLLMVPAALWVGQSAVERALLAGCCLLVLVVELLNTAVEAVVDRIGQEPNHLAGRAKDLGSAAVFVSLLLAGLVWGLLLWERFAPGG